MSARADPRWRAEHLAVVGLCGVAVIALRWLPQLPSSLWLDETGTVWLLQGGFTDALARALEYQGGSPLFYVVEWPFAYAFGGSELALRLPSTIGMTVAAGLVFLLGKRLFDAASGAVAAGIFVALPLVGFAAADARPYAFATMTLVTAALALVRWVDSGRPADAALYGCAFVATVYLHYLMALPLLAHGAYLLARRDRSAVRARRALLVYGAIGIALVPAVPTLLRVLSQRASLSNPFPMTPAEVAGALIPPSLAIATTAVGVLAALLWRTAEGLLDLDDGVVVMLLAWIAIPFVALVALSTIGSTSVLVPRYFTSVLPAVALLAGALVGRIRAPWAQVAIVAVTAAVAVVRFPASEHTHEDWRAAAALERTLVDDAQTPVLMFAGFIEARQVDWLEDPEKASYLTAPATAYDFDGDVMAVPFGIGDDSEPFMEELERTKLENEDEFVLVTRGIDSIREWLEERLAAERWSSTEEGSFGGEILVYSFSRS